MNNILITGGAGFIGSHLATAYVSRGCTVTVIDDLSTGRLDNLAHLKCNAPEAQLRVIVDSVCNEQVMDYLISMSDVVYHFAAAVGVLYVMDNPLLAMSANIRGTEVVLESCKKHRKPVVIASTSEVYGKHMAMPLAEEDDCIYGPSTRLRWSYAASKLIDEFMALGYFRHHSVPAIIVRFFNTVGPRQSGQYGMVMPRFFDRALANEPIYVYGDGQQTRTFTHVQEVVEALFHLVATPAAIGQVINIGAVEEITILELAQRIKRKTNSASEIVLVPYDQAFSKDFEDMPRRVPSTDKLMKLIGRVPEMTIDQILDDLFADRQRHGIPPATREGQRTSQPGPELLTGAQLA